MVTKLKNGTVVEKYLWKDLTTLLATFDASGIYYLAYDQVGSLRAVSDTSGNIVKELSYDSFGNILSDSNPSMQLPFAFAGGLYDKDTNIVRFGYCDFDPVTGKWTAKDPIGFNGGDTSLYGYVLGNPVNFVDLDGFFPTHIGTDTKLKPALKDSGLPKKLKELLEKPAKEIDEFIHHNIGPNWPIDLTIKPYTDNLNIDGIGVMFEIKF